jgi:hypothetical protein
VSGAVPVSGEAVKFATGAGTGVGVVLVGIVVAVPVGPVVNVPLGLNPKSEEASTVAPLPPLYTIWTRPGADPDY